MPLIILLFNGHPGFLLSEHSRIPVLPQLFAYNSRSLKTMFEGVISMELTSLNASFPLSTVVYGSKTDYYVAL